MPKETKRCPSCVIRRPVKDFPTPRHKICVHCVEARLKSVAWFRSPAHALGVPAIDKSSREYTNWLARTNYRVKRMKSVPPPVFLPKEKRCRRCTQFKPLSEFDTYRMRICRACDGPTIR